jgi:hypothetical protein
MEQQMQELRSQLSETDDVVGGLEKVKRRKKQSSEIKVFL